jgi:hypothetical protein
MDMKKPCSTHKFGWMEEEHRVVDKLLEVTPWG